MIETSKEPLLLAGFGEAFFCFEHEVGGTFAQAPIGDQADRIFYLLALKESVDGRHGKSGIGPHQNRGLRIGLFETPNDPLENCRRSFGGMCVARPQHRGQGETAHTVENEQGVEHILIIVAVKH